MNATTDAERLQAEAVALEHAAEQPASPAGAIPPAGEGAAAPRVDYNAEARDVVQFWRVLICSVGPSLEAIYDDATCDRLATALAPVMAKYELSLNKFGPELVLAAVAVPLAVRTYQAVKVEAKRRQELADQRKREKEQPHELEPGAQRPVTDAIDPASLHTKA
jgi:hypothetical protein